MDISMVKRQHAQLVRRTQLYRNIYGYSSTHGTHASYCNTKEIRILSKLITLIIQSPCSHVAIILKNKYDSMYIGAHEGLELPCK